MVYIIGVDHLVQYNGPVPERLREEFRDYLVAISRTHNIGLIAEEFSLEALREVYRATKCTAREAARFLGIRHRFCDPEESDMRKMGIPYYAEILDRVKKERGIDAGFILDNTLRARVRDEATAVSKTYWHLRESFWYNSIVSDFDVNILFICGHEHSERFQSVIREQGNECLIIEKFWGVGLFTDYRNLNLD